MAQIIKHRRGSLEALSAVTSSLQKGELVIASGSSNLSVTNGASIVFAVPENGQVQAVNRFLVGNAAPNTFAAGTYNGLVKGVPYYASGSSTLYLLGEGANDIPDLTGNISNFSSSVSASISALSASIGGGSIGNSVTLLSSKTGSYATTGSNIFVGDQTITGSLAINDSATNFLIEGNGFSQTYLTSNGAIVLNPGFGGVEMVGSYRTFQATDITAQGTLSASVITGIGNVTAFSSSVDIRLSNLQSTSASVNISVAALNTSSASQQTSIDALNSYTSSNTSTTALNSFTASAETRFTEIGVVSGSLIASASTAKTTNDSQGVSITNLNSFSASTITSLSELNSYSSSLKQAFTASGVNVTFSGDVTIPGNFTVRGTQTIVDSTTVQLGDNIIELNGSAAANGGLYVKDVTNPNTATGSIIWDSTNDYWKAGAKDSESKVLLAGGDSVVSGSSQITISNTTGYGDFSGSISSSIAALSASVGSGAGISITNLNSFSSSTLVRLSNIESFSSSAETRFTEIGVVSGSLILSASAAKTTNDSQGVSITNLNSFSGSQLTQNGTLATYTASVDTRLTEIGVVSGSLIASASTSKTTNDTQDVRLTNIESFSGSQLTQNGTLATYTGSVDTRLTEIGVVSGSLILSASAAKTTNDSQGVSITNLNSFSASVNTSVTALNSSSASQQTSIDALNSYTSSNTSTTALNSFTASAEQRFTEIGVVSGSLILSASNAVSRLTTLEGAGTIQGVGTSNNVTFAKVTTTGDVVVGGDLVVQGNTVTLNTATLIVEDKLITLASGSTSSATADGSGFEVAGAGANFIYQHSTTAFTSSVALITPAVTSSFNLGSAAGSSKRVAFRNTNGNLDLVPTASVAGDLLQWDGTDFVMSNVVDGGSF
jgi:acyl-coenzyme A thioesterase PaaI-like protein